MEYFGRRSHDAEQHMQEFMQWWPFPGLFLIILGYFQVFIALISWQ